MSKLKTRLISALVGAIFVLGVIFSTPIIFHVAVVATCFLVLYELHVTFKQETKWQLIVLDYVFAFVMLLSPLFKQDIQRETLMAFMALYVMLLLSLSVVWHESVKFTDVTRSFFMLTYAVLLPMHLTFIRAMDMGVVLIFLPFLGAWMPDTFAYFAGSLFGKHKLIPSISPNKTVEGSIGAIVGALLMFAVYGLVVSGCFGYRVNYPLLMLLAFLCGIIAQFGDLAASVIKRECNTKDFGNIIPGHGGILDRVDSLLFVAPVVYYFLLMFEVVYK